MRCVGIDIGSHSLKVAEVEAGPRGLIVHQFALYPLSQYPGRDQQIELIERLRLVSEAYRDQNVRWIFSLPQHLVSSRHRRFPFRERSKIQKTLPFELEDEIPLDPDDAVFDSRIVEFFGSAADVMVVASRTEDIEQVLERAKDGGMDPEIVTPEGLGLANLFSDWQGVAPEGRESSAEDVADRTYATTVRPLATAVLQVGHRYSLLLVHRGGILLAIRNLSTGAYDVAQAVGKVFSQPISEAIDMVQRRSFILLNTVGATNEQIAMSNAVTGAYKELVQELRIALTDIRAEFGIEIDHCQLVGGGTLIQNFPAWLTQHIEVPCNPMSFLQQMRDVRPPITPITEALSATAVGIAIEGLRRARNPAINLRKGILQRENKERAKFIEKWKPLALSLATAVCVLCAWVFIRGSMATMAADRAEEAAIELGKKVAALKGSSASLTGIERWLKEKDDVVAKAKALDETKDYISPFAIFADLSNRIGIEKRGAKAPTTAATASKPSTGLGIERLSLNHDRLVIEGSVFESSRVSSIEAGLRELATSHALNKAQRTGPSAPAGATAFAYEIKVARRPL